MLTKLHVPYDLYVGAGTFNQEEASVCEIFAMVRCELYWAWRGRGENQARGLVRVYQWEAAGMQPGSPNWTL